MAADPRPEGVRGLTGEEMADHLAEWLRFAVPLHIARLRGVPADRRRFYLPHGWHGLVSMADSMMFPSRFKGAKKGRAELASNLYARGLAVLAYEPGGVTLFGAHFCTAPHDGCPADWTPREPLHVAAVMAEFDRILDQAAAS